MKKKHSILRIVICLILALFVVFELACMLICKGNFVVDSLVFNAFETCAPYSQHTVLRENQYVTDDIVHTVIRDSVDFEIFIDDNPLYIDTLFQDDGFIIKRKSCWLRPGRHDITLKSDALNVSYTYPVHCFLFMVVYVESGDDPCFWITKHYLPLRRRLI